MQKLFWLVLLAVMALGVQTKDSRADEIQLAQSNHFQIYYLNQCNRRIQTAIHYRDLNGNWVTNGWWNLDPGEQAFVATTTNRIFYTYAESIAPVNSRIYWNGSVRHFKIRGSSRTYGFRDRRMDMSNWGTWTERFTCN